MLKTVLVTGASGFIGSNLCERLYEDHKVIAIGNCNENYVKCNAFFQEISWDLIPDIDICFHLGANNDTTDLNMGKMLQANLISPAHFFSKLATDKNCKQFVYSSSGSVYGNQPVPYIEDETILNPLNPYAESKRLFEEYANFFAIKFNVNVIGLRYTNVFGPGEKFKEKRASMIHQLLHKMLANEIPKIFKNGEQLRDWVYVDDVVEANVLSSKHNGSGVFNVGSGEDMSFNDIVKTLNLELKTNLESEYIECSYKDKYQSHTLANLDKAKKKLGYFPKYSIQEGIKKFVEETKKAG